MAGQFDNNLDLNPKLKGTDRQLFDEFATILGHCGTAASENIKSNATSPHAKLQSGTAEQQTPCLRYARWRRLFVRVCVSFLDVFRFPYAFRFFMDTAKFMFWKSLRCYIIAHLRPESLLFLASSSSSAFLAAACLSFSAFLASARTVKFMYFCNSFGSGSALPHLSHRFWRDNDVYGMILAKPLATLIFCLFNLKQRLVGQPFSSVAV